MAKKSMIAKAKRGSRFGVREHNRCQVCGRPRAYMRRFSMCRTYFLAPAPLPPPTERR